MSHSLAKRFILLAGSISRATESSLVQLAQGFVEEFVQEVLNQGGGFVIYVSAEPVNDDGHSLLFDWTVARTVNKLMHGDSDKPVLKIVAAQERLETRANAEQRILLKGMIARNVAELVTLEAELVTGGNVRDEQVGIADMMVALGGGKGVLDRARQMTKRSLPVLPLDMQLGALSEDGDGALGIDKAFRTNPLTYFPYTGQSVARILSGLSLQEPVLSNGEIAKRIVKLFYEQEQARISAMPPDVLVLTALDVELAAAKQAFGIAEDTAPTTTSTGIHVWKALVSRRSGKTANCAIACFAGAGNNDAAAITATLLGELKPDHVVMLGIAAGLRQKCALGEVILVDRVVAYEGAAITKGGKVEHRPEISRVNLRYRQDLSYYLSNTHSLQQRLVASYQSMGIVFPEDVDAGPVAKGVTPRLATIGSGEKLLRDAETFQGMRELHGKLEAVEMEAAGIFAACAANEKPVLMVRGISDFGDEKKDNRFHLLAAQAAAAVTVDYICNGITLQS